MRRPGHEPAPFQADAPTRVPREAVQLAVTVGVFGGTAQLAGCGSDAAESAFHEGDTDAGDESTSPPDFGHGGDRGMGERFASIVLSPADPIVTIDLNQRRVGQRSAGGSCPRIEDTMMMPTVVPGVARVANVTCDPDAPPNTNLAC